MAFALDVGDRMGKNAPMPRWLLWTVCVLMAALVAVICIVPGWHLYPLTLRMAAFFFVLLLLLSGCFHPTLRLMLEAIPAFLSRPLPDIALDLRPAVTLLRC